MRSKGVKRRVRTKDGRYDVWFSGCGTILGATSRPDEALDLGRDANPFCRFSRRGCWVGIEEDAKAARASSTGSGASPSKNLAIAIYSNISRHLSFRSPGQLHYTCTFHSDLRKRGMAAEGSWFVMDV